MYIYAEIATSGVNNWAILRDWHGGVLTKLVISYPILELASIFWYHWMYNIQEGTIHMLTYSYTERNQPQIIKIGATPTFLVCLSPRVKCTQLPVGVDLLRSCCVRFAQCTSGVCVRSDQHNHLSTICQFQGCRHNHCVSIRCSLLNR